MIIHLMMNILRHMMMLYLILIQKINHGVKELDMVDILIFYLIVPNQRIR